MIYARAGHNEEGALVHPLGFTDDHVRPRSKGNGLMRNKVLAHIHCNKAKGNREPTADELRILEHLYNEIPLEVARFLP